MAAVVGSRLDLSLVAGAMTREPSGVAADLDPAVQAGLVIPLGPATGAYRFPHDRVQQAAPPTIERTALSEIHLRAGELMLRQRSDETSLFAAVGHLNAAAELLSDPARRLEVARLNLRAATHLAAGELEESARALRAVVEVIPDDPVALDYLARATVARRARLLGHETLAPTPG